ncbi:MAG: hypothetical protein JWM95_1564 [Gemmatimonadetes bacterium]|nr:hypothetical protein [Gemmatimonadota bacterium]
MAETSRIFLWDPIVSASVEALLWDEITTSHLAQWEKTWVPERAAIRKRLEDAKISKDQWPQSIHWEWPIKIADVSGLLAYAGFAVTCGNALEGLMRVALHRSARLPSEVGKPLVYIDYVEVAPWNWPAMGKPLRYKGIGTALLTAAVILSRKEGFYGRVGLHSLPQAAAFYVKAGMATLGEDPDVEGLDYFELSPAAASAFLGKEADL